MPMSLWVLQEAGQEVLFWLHHWNFGAICHGGLVMQEVLLAHEEDVHSVASNTEDISGVFVDVLLEV